MHRTDGEDIYKQTESVVMLFGLQFQEKVCALSESFNLVYIKTQKSTGCKQEKTLKLFYAMRFNRFFCIFAKLLNLLSHLVVGEEVFKSFLFIKTCDKRLKWQLFLHDQSKMASLWTVLDTPEWVKRPKADTTRFCGGGW